jgi:RimJ/RimL family protein N-acetyltransferase
MKTLCPPFCHQIESNPPFSFNILRYWLAPEYHGKGLMAKALKMMLYRISVVEAGKRKFNSFAFVDNWASRRTLEKVGFVVQDDMSRSIVKYGTTIPQWVLRLYLTEEDVERWGKETIEAKPLPSLVH